MSLVGIGLCFWNLLTGSTVIAFAAYVMGHWVLKRHSRPFVYSTRIVLAAGFLLSTAFITLMPWTFYGGHEGCSAFSPTMETRHGYHFGDFWTLMWALHAVNWILLPIVVNLVLAEHPASTYVRDSWRCVAFTWAAQAMKTAGMVMWTCTGSDRNKDGVRDSAYVTQPLARFLLPASGTMLFFCDIWCLRLMQVRLRALEESFGEPLPFTQPIRWLCRIVTACALSGTFVGLLPNAVIFVGFAASTLGLGSLTLLMCLSIQVPLKALTAMPAAQGDPSASDGVGSDSVHSLRHGSSRASIQLEDDMAFARKVLRRSQLAVILAGLSMVWHHGAFGLRLFAPSKLVFSAYQYGHMCNMIGNILGLTLLSGNQITFPGSSRLSLSKRNSAGLAPKRSSSDMSTSTPDAQQRPRTSYLQQDLECTCQQVGKTRSVSSFGHSRSQREESIVAKVLSVSSWRHARDPSCEKCAWEDIVQQISNRRITVGQLLDFHAQLSPQKGVMTALMPHFDAGRSTTNDVVRHAIIPRSRCDDVGRALAEIFMLEATSRRWFSAAQSPPRMVTHHWANCFRDLVAAVVADSLGLTRWDSIADQLQAGREASLRKRLQDCGALRWCYWTWF